MGYSCSAKAHEVFMAITDAAMAEGPVYTSDGKQLNGSLAYKNQNFFAEIGREQPDGSITGSVFQLCQRIPVESLWQSQWEVFELKLMGWFAGSQWFQGRHAGLDKGFSHKQFCTKEVVG